MVCIGLRLLLLCGLSITRAAEEVNIAKHLRGAQKYGIMGVSQRRSARKRKGAAMEPVAFTPIRRHSRAARLALPLWLAYRAEIKCHGDENPIAPLADFRQRVERLRSSPNRHFDLLRIGKNPAGFAYYAVCTEACEQLAPAAGCSCSIMSPRNTAGRAMGSACSCTAPRPFTAAARNVSIAAQTP